MKTIKYFSVLVLLAVIFVSCSGIPEYTGDTMTLKTGEEGVLKLDADTKSGYDWVIGSNSDPAVATMSGKENTLPEKTTSKNTQVIKIKGLKKGKTIFTFNLVKKNDVLVKKTRTLNVTVY
jgi:predicted secreted protein